MHSPSGAEMPRRCVSIRGLTRNETSSIQTLKRAMTNPRLITAMFVLTQARKVRSLARISDSILSGSSWPFSCGGFVFVSLELDIHHQFVPDLRSVLRRRFRQVVTLCHELMATILD